MCLLISVFENELCKLGELSAFLQFILRMYGKCFGSSALDRILWSYFQKINHGSESGSPFRSRLNSFIMLGILNCSSVEVLPKIYVDYFICEVANGIFRYYHWLNRYMTFDKWQSRKLYQTCIKIISNPTIQVIKGLDIPQNVFVALGRKATCSQS